MARSVLSAPHSHNEDAAFAYVEMTLWPDGPDCPHCGATGDHVRKLKGKTTRKGLHKCYACRKALSEQIGLSRLARSLSVQECKTPSGISTVRPRSSGSL